LKRLILLLALLLTFTGCGPVDEGGGPKGKPLATYTLEVSTKDKDHDRIRLQLVCVVEGRSLEGNVIKVKDTTTGKTAPYRIVIDDIAFKSPQRLELITYTGVAIIYVRCGALGRPGDTILCEPLDPTGNIAALRRGDRVFDEAVRGHLNLYCEMEIIVT